MAWFFILSPFPPVFIYTSGYDGKRAIIYYSMDFFGVGDNSFSSNRLFYGHDSGKRSSGIGRLISFVILFFDEKNLKITGLSGSLGNSSCTQLTGQIELTESADFENTDGKMNLSADELFPWITSFEKIEPVLKEVPSMKGTIILSSLNLRGPLYHPKEWEFLVNGEVKKFTLVAAFLPGKADETDGMFNISQDELSLKDVRTRLIDSSLTVSGTLSKFPADIRTVDLSLRLLPCSVFLIRRGNTSKRFSFIQLDH